MGVANYPYVSKGSLLTENLIKWMNLADGTGSVFHPSTDISAAWEVAKRYPIATIERVEIFVGNVEVKATLWEGFDYIDPVEATAKTVPEAICKCALLTVMDKEAEAK